MTEVDAGGARGSLRLRKPEDEVGRRTRTLFESEVSEADRRRATFGLRQFLQAERIRSSAPDGDVPGDDPGAYLEFLIDCVIRGAANVASPRSFGNMSGITPPFMRAIADVVVGLNQNLVKRDASPSLTAIERATIAFLHGLVFGVGAGGDGPLGIAASGGTLANITALWCARNRAFPNVQLDGTAAALQAENCDRAVVIGSALMHYSIDKAACALGLGERSVLRIVVDRRGRVDTHAMRVAVGECIARRWKPIALVGVAGTTDCGSIDPLDGIADIAAEHGIHFHADAAWGATLLFSPEERRRLAGIERATTVTIDAHKQLYAPVGLSYVLFRDPATAKVIEREANYLLQNGSGDLGAWSLEGSRSGASLYAHAALHVIGAGGFAWLVRQNLGTARAFAARIDASADFELLASPETNIVLYRYLPPQCRRAVANRSLPSAANAEIDQVNRDLHARQSAGGRSYVARTTIAHAGRYRGERIVALRAILANPLTGTDDLAFVLDDQRRIAAAIGQEGA